MRACELENLNEGIIREPPNYRGNTSSKPITTFLNNPIVARVDFSLDSYNKEHYEELIYTANSVNELIDDFRHDLSLMKDYFLKTARHRGFDPKHLPQYDELTQLFVNGTLIPRHHEWFAQLHSELKDVVN